MNIVFFTDVEITPYQGGVERVTANLVKELSKRGHRCFLVFFSASEGEVCDDFEKRIQLDGKHLEEQLNNILIKNDINACVINLCRKHNIFAFNKTLYDVMRTIGHIKVIYGYYTYPGFELIGLSASLAWFRLTHGQCNSNTIHGILASVSEKLHCNGFIYKTIAKKLKMGLYSDEIVLLSEHYISRYLSFIGKENTHIFSAIGNPLSYPQNIDIEKIKGKDKIVIQVARFDDNFKRQTTALKIWKKIEEDGGYNDWHFIMIGYGPDELYIKNTLNRLHLKNVEILPAQNPLSYLEKASIYMLTSAYEGLPMIVLDAQQQGVTPIGFDSFEAIHDVIIDHENGIIIPNNHIDCYVEKLKWLMQHHEDREKMAYKGLETCQKFSVDKIINEWERVLGNN